MFARNIINKKDLLLFLFLTLVILAQALWWIIFMARLVDEKVDLAAQFGADEQYVEILHQQEISRQVMVGLEGIFFLVLILAGAWMIIRSHIKTVELKFHQHNFLMAVTHELKTPLASLKIYMDSLQSPKIPDDKKTGIVPKMKNDVVRLEKLVENILDASRFEHGGYQLNREELNLTEMVEKAMDNLQLHPLEKPLEINRNLKSGVSYYGDAKALNRALMPILENCLVYNTSDKIVLNIELENQNSDIILKITDNGIGLKKSDTSRIFDRFYRVGDEIKRSQPGTGLGLYLSRELIRAHGSEITAKSPGPGKGTTFIIRFKENAKSKNDLTG